MKRENPVENQNDHSDIDENGSKKVKADRLLPKKADYRMRAHINPLNTTNFPYPHHWSYVSWKEHYPLLFGGSETENQEIHCNTVEHPSNYDQKSAYNRNPEFIDIGCGYGGLLFGLSQRFPNKRVLGLEIRDKLVNFVGEKIRGKGILEPKAYNNLSVVRTNTMRHLCQYFKK